MSQGDLKESFAATQTDPIVQRAAASIRIFTREASVDFITEALGCQPARSRLIGQPVTLRVPDAPKYADSLWTFSSCLPETEPLNEHVGYLCEFLKDRDLALGAIRPRILASDVFCMFSSENGQGACAVSCEHLGILAACEMELVIDLYPPAPGVWDAWTEALKPFISE